MERNPKLEMSLDDLISAEKRRDRSPRRFKQTYNRLSLDDDISAEKRHDRSHAHDDKRQRPKEPYPPHAMIKVSNIPSGLTWYDVKDAFKSVGPVERCDVDHGTAWVKFSDPRHAQAAVKEYNGGDLNGNIIRVCHA